MKKLKEKDDRKVLPYYQNTIQISGFANRLMINNEENKSIPVFDIWSLKLPHLIELQKNVGKETILEEVWVMVVLSC